MGMMAAEVDATSRQPMSRVESTDDVIGYVTKFLYALVERHCYQNFHFVYDELADAAYYI